MASSKRAACTAVRKFCKDNGLEYEEVMSEITGPSKPDKVTDQLWKSPEGNIKRRNQVYYIIATQFLNYVSM